MAKEPRISWLSVAEARVDPSMFSTHSAQARRLARKGGLVKVPGYIYRAAAVQDSIRLSWRRGVAESSTIASLMRHLQLLDASVRWEAFRTDARVSKGFRVENEHVVYTIQQRKVCGWRNKYLVCSSGLFDDGTEGNGKEWLYEHDIPRLNLIRAWEELQVRGPRELSAWERQDEVIRRHITYESNLRLQEQRAIQEQKLRVENEKVQQELFRVHEERRMQLQLEHAEECLRRQRLADQKVKGIF